VPEGGDAGSPTVDTQPDAPAAVALRVWAAAVVARVGMAAPAATA
jgi:hypothetical protein